jgi:hypothetical protein
MTILGNDAVDIEESIGILSSRRGLLPVDWVAGSSSLLAAVSIKLKKPLPVGR